MATFSDYLETVIALKGGQAYAAALNQASAAVQRLANSSALQTKVSLGQTSAMSAGLTSLALNVAGTLAAAAAVREFVKAAETEEDATFRTTVLLRNLGNTFPIEKAQAFADSLSQTTSASRSQILQLIGMEKQFGVADSKVEGLTKTLLDAAKGNARGLGYEEVANAALRGMSGQARGLKALGIQFTDTGNKAENLRIIQQKLNALFPGAAAAERNTLSGAFEHLSSSWEHFAASITGLIPVINALASALDKMAGHPSLSTGAAGAALGFGIGRFFGPVGALVGTAIGGIGGALLGTQGKNPNAAAQIGSGENKLATEDTLKQVAENTKTTADAFVKAVLGGPGAIAKEAFTIRDAKIAFGV